MIAEERPTEVAVEKVFVNVNPNSTLLLGQARGAAIAAAVLAGLPVTEYTAGQVKQAVVGVGRAQKTQVQAMVRRLLLLPGNAGSRCRRRARGRDLPRPCIDGARRSRQAAGIGCACGRLLSPVEFGSMIGRLSGILLEKNPPQLLLDVHGVAYEVDVPMSTYYNLPVIGERITLYTHLVVREDAHLLYGFGTEDERRAFRQLIKVNGHRGQDRAVGAVGAFGRRACSGGDAAGDRAPHAGPGNRQENRGAPDAGAEGQARRGPDTGSGGRTAWHRTRRIS